ncbi:formate--phosphoribosylaminoimidazolecarboxamide ligase [Candidatus Micrarchaeota archaeon]|nr:formate--phosphoribosylaminoimidazolecarboxamide ligase [Candidatus Micrarchaeota archaeon]
MLEKEKIDSIVEGYKELNIATICSHSALQIFYGAKKQGIKTTGICTKERKKFYESFPYAKPDEFILVDSYNELPVDELVSRNAVIIPHGSFVEYLGRKIDDAEVPIYGNRNSLKYERSRERMFEWMEKAGLKIPERPKAEEINGPTIVKTPGAKGGHGYIVVNSYEEFKKRIGERKDVMLQEFIIGVRTYPHFFHSIYSKAGMETGYGKTELLGMDRRLESNADEIGRALHVGAKDNISFSVMGNEPMVLRESLLPEVVKAGANIARVSKELFGGIFGPFCIEMIITDELEIYAFEVSARIVAGTNVGESPYSIYSLGKETTTGERIALELKEAFKRKELNRVVH